MQSSCLQSLLCNEPQLDSTLKKKIALNINIQNALDFMQTHLIKQEDREFF